MRAILRYPSAGQTRTRLPCLPPNPVTRRLGASASRVPWRRYVGVVTGCCYPRAPSIQIIPTFFVIPTLGPKVYTCDLLWAIWSPRVRARWCHVCSLALPGRTIRPERGPYSALIRTFEIYLKYTPPHGS